MIIGIGSDLIDIRRIEKSLERHGERFVQRIFTEAEQARAEGRAHRAATYAKRFAAKEACAKALGCGIADGVFWRDMGVVNEPGGRVTLEEEIETLKLYLDIERMRFEERLRTEFRIEPSVGKALLPSLLLQPLVENAIKYAVSPQEEGAQISISARLVGQRLRITVADSGPGLQNGGARPNFGPAYTGGAGIVSSTGVGLANIRDRLMQAYGEDHVFETRTPAQGGFTVVIEIPFEVAEEEEKNTLPKPHAPAAVVTPAAPSTYPAEGPAQRELGLRA